MIFKNNIFNLSTTFLFISFSFFLFLSKSEYKRLIDPTGRYTAIISIDTFWSSWTSPPGSSRDKPCTVKIINTKTGFNYGEIPVEMLQLVEIIWAESSARIKLVGEWNFEKKSCWYWSNNQHKKSCKGTREFNP